MKLIIFIWCSLFSVFSVEGQMVHIKHKSRDTSYVKDFYSHYLILRAFTCTRSNNFKLIDGQDKLIFKTNRHYDIGVGFNYKSFSFNFAFNAPLTLKNEDKFGKTRTFDIQTYLYVRDFVVDYTAQFFKGYYLSNSSDALTGPAPVQILKMPDINTADLSLNATYIFNNGKFSFNAPFFQNEIQTKSAGSFLLGGGIYYNHGKTDSSFIPTGISKADFFQNHHFNKFSYSAVGCNIGYAYTFVIKKQYFITGILTGGPGLGYSVIRNTHLDQSNIKTGFTYNASAKFAAGWSSDEYYAGVTYVMLVAKNNSVAPDTWAERNSGNLRLTVAKRFKLKKSLIPKNDKFGMD